MNGAAKLTRGHQSAPDAASRYVASLRAAAALLQAPEVDCFEVARLIVEAQSLAPHAVGRYARSLSGYAAELQRSTAAATTSSDADAQASAPRTGRGVRP